MSVPELFRKIGSLSAGIISRAFPGYMYREGRERNQQREIVCKSGLFGQDGARVRQDRERRKGEGEKHRVTNSDEYTET